MAWGEGGANLATESPDVVQSVTLSKAGPQTNAKQYKKAPIGRARHEQHARPSGTGRRLVLVGSSPPPTPPSRQHTLSPSQADQQIRTLGTYRAACNFRVFRFYRLPGKRGKSKGVPTGLAVFPLSLFFSPALSLSLSLTLSPFQPRTTNSTSPPETG